MNPLEKVLQGDVAGAPTCTLGNRTENGQCDRRGPVNVP
jgi:hypothetical protein